MNQLRIGHIELETQKRLFEGMHDRYSEATTDRWSEAYKEEFVYAHFLRYLDGVETLMELASGVGTASGWLRKRKPGLLISGCDISENAVRDFTLRHGRPCHVWDLTVPVEPEEQYDAVLVVGGIHHLVSNLPQTFANIDRMLKPGGKLIMSEPNADFVLEPLRKLWYRLDTQTFDANNEHALSHPKLVREHSGALMLIDLNYIGGPAYFVLLQNWVLRIPNGAKKWFAPVLMRLERLYHHLPGRFPFATFIACWQKPKC